MAKWTHSMILAAGLAAFFLPARAETVDVPAVLQINPDQFRGPAGEAGPPGTVPQEWKDQLNALEGRVQALEDWAASSPADPPAEEPPAEEPPAEEPPVEDPPAEEPPAEDPPQASAITPLQFGAQCDSAAIDAWLTEVEARDVVGHIPEGMTCLAGNIADRLIEQDIHLDIDGTLDFQGRGVGWGLNAANVTVEGDGKITGCKLAFVSTPDNSEYHTGLKFPASIPFKITRDFENYRFDLALWDGCAPYVLVNYSAYPVNFDPVRSQYRIKKAFFRGEVRNAIGGFMLMTNRFGQNDAMEIRNGAIFSGAPMIEVRDSKFTNIDGRNVGKALWACRAVVIGGGPFESEDQNGSVRIADVTINGVYCNGFWWPDGNETQAIRVQNGRNFLIRDTYMGNVRHAGVNNDLVTGEQKKDQWNHYVDNAECLYDKAINLWVVRTTFENCDGAGLDASAWTQKSRGAVFGRDIVIKWTHPTWTRYTCRVVRLAEAGGDLQGVTVGGYETCEPWGHPNSYVQHLIKSFNGTPTEERVSGLTFNGQQVN